MKTCIKCGKEHDGIEDVCEACKGTSLTNAANKGKLSTGSILSILASAAAILFLFSGQLFKKPIKDLTKDPYVTPGFSLDDYKADSSYIKGTVSAETWKDTNMAIEIYFYDKNKSILETKYDYSPSLNPGDSWAFSVVIPRDSAYYKITRVASTYYG